MLRRDSLATFFERRDGDETALVIMHHPMGHRHLQNSRLVAPLMSDEFAATAARFDTLWHPEDILTAADHIQFGRLMTARSHTRLYMVNMGWCLSLSVQRGSLVIFICAPNDSNREMLDGNYPAVRKFWNSPGKHADILSVESVVLSEGMSM